MLIKCIDFHCLIHPVPFQYSVVNSVSPRYVHDTDCDDSGSSRGLSTTVINAGVCSFVVNLVNMCPSGSALHAGVQCVVSGESIIIYVHTCVN